MQPETPVTLERLRAVLAEKGFAGHNTRIRALLAKYGAPKLSQIDPIHYQALLAEAEVIQ